MSTLTAEQGRIAYQGQRRADAGTRRARVAAMTRAGMSAAEIAAQLSITPRTVQRDRRATGTAQPEPTPMADREHAIAAALAADGASASEIARTLGRARKTITHHYPHSAWTQEQKNTHLQLIHLERAIR